ncbi:DUF3102 domain-containing protein [Aneurinibacillus sp. REN35]|uniref:DUF3102 domain-containing protein n=1 Tax=Aneurinibacillus sp. REN35 TaxID=3237286 RepID=UPI003527C530
MTLSMRIEVITEEIVSYKKRAGESIYEIGRRLNHVKKNRLIHGQWERWLKESVKISPPMARKYIAIYEVYESDPLFRSLTNDLEDGGNVELLYDLATFPKELRQELHTIPSNGQRKKITEMNTKERREVKRLLSGKSRDTSSRESDLKRSVTDAIRRLNNNDDRLQKIAAILELAEAVPEDKSQGFDFADRIFGDSAYKGGTDLTGAYYTLGVRFAASPREVRQAYRETVKRVHPDTGGNNEAFIKVKAAYDFLKANRFAV